MPPFGKYRLRVELHALDSKCPVTKRHDHPGLCSSCHLKFRRHRAWIHREGVVSSRGEWVGEASEHTFTTVVHQ